MEEMAEYHADWNIEELADLMEVIRACAVARGLPSRSWSRFVRRKPPSVADLRKGFC